MMGFSVVYWIEDNLAKNDFTQIAEPIEGKQDYVLIKMPLSLPYQTDWSTPTQVKGTLRQGDKHYQMISQKLVNDTLYTVCKIDQTARDRFFNLASHINEHVSDHDNDLSKKSSSQLLKNFVKEYMSSEKRHIFFVLDWVYPRPKTIHVFTTWSRSLDTHSPPPRHS
ncbi:hypothetical protein [Flectobacillus major]|jgi:hypothetical protein|uniref:hypothetical protein n=1 Tax=Flectobacillus major TaxID=103 RepID=UPI00069343A5|nr:hypothetical protein [Flectobacillus major]